MQASPTPSSPNRIDILEDCVLLWTDAEGRILRIDARDPSDLFHEAERLVGRLLASVPDLEASRAIREGLRSVKETGHVVSIAYELPVRGVRRLYKAQMVPQLEGGVCAVIRRSENGQASYGR